GLRSTGGDCDVSLIYAAEFSSVRVNMNELLRKLGRRQQLIAIGRNIAEPRSECDEKIGFTHATGQRRIHAKAQVADVVWTAIVQHILSAERAGDRKIPRFHKTLQVTYGLLAPVRPAND